MAEKKTNNYDTYAECDVNILVANLKSFDSIFGSHLEKLMGKILSSSYHLMTPKYLVNDP